MARSNILGQLFRQTGIYSRSLVFFVVLAGVATGGYYLFTHTSLRAVGTLNGESAGYQEDSNTWELSLGQDGNLYLGQSSSIKLKPEVFHQGDTYRYRYQVISNPDQFYDQITVLVSLPKAGTEELIGHRFAQNGGASSVESELLDPQTIKYAAYSVDKNAQLSIEFEVPDSFVERSALMSVRETLSALPPYVWIVISIFLPLVTALLLLIMGLGRMRRVEPAKANIEGLPSRLPPALLGILLRGRITSRELAATLVDLARRGHLVIRQVDWNDYRFRRTHSDDKLADFEQVMLDQIFGASSERTDSEEISFYLAQELFSKKVSQSFFMAYKKMSQLGYFYTNPLSLHRRYQFAGLAFFVLGVLGFFTNLLLISGAQYLLFFWTGMILSALLVMMFSRGIPVRTTLGDRELATWLAFRRYMVDKAPVSYMAFSQDKYLAYLPYAIIFECEAEWTRRYYDFPFSQPNWYVAANISTVEKFANQLFPLLGYLSHVLSISAQPAAR